jgi:hypothetical protein
MFESDYVRAGPISRRSQLIAALRQRSSIVIEDQELAHQFARIVQAEVW